MGRLVAEAPRRPAGQHRPWGCGSRAAGGSPASGGGGAASGHVAGSTAAGPAVGVTHPVVFHQDFYINPVPEGHRCVAWRAERCGRGSLGEPPVPVTCQVHPVLAAG